MDENTRRMLQAAAGAAGEKIYVEDVFSTYLYTGSGSTPQTLTTGVDLSGKNGMIMYKKRSGSGPTWSTSAAFSDLCWGIKYIRLVQGSDGNPISQNYDFETWTTSGVTLNYNYDQYNASGDKYVAWTFRNADKFFQAYEGQVFNYTTTTLSFPKLGTIGMVILQGTVSGSGTPIYVWHRSLTAGNLLSLNTTQAQYSSSLISVSGTDVTITGTGGFGSYSLYAFAHDAGGYGNSGNDSVIKCGSYTGNGSTSGPTINLGWEPQWLLIKNATTAGNYWVLIDNMRGFSVTGNQWLYPNDSAAEGTTGLPVAPLATGFQPRSSGTFVNESGSTYIYIAIRRGPMKTPTDATNVFTVDTGTNGTSGGIVTTGFPVDLSWTAYRSLGGVAATNDRLRGFGTANAANNTPLLYTSETSAENTGSNPYFYNAWNTTLTRGSNGANPGGAGIVSWFFRRAPGFFDVVAATSAAGVNDRYSHNLGITPELIIGKTRSASGGWSSYVASLGRSSYINLNSTAVASTVTDIWGTSNPTATDFGIDNSGSGFGNGTATLIFYLFASCPGVSKVGSYTGTGTTQQINCGFTAGARFVLIKRTDSTGDWYVWDTARGIISGNDPYLLLNSAAAEVTNTDYIDPLSSGFEISSTAPAAINANGGSFIFLAVA